MDDQEKDEAGENKERRIGDEVPEEQDPSAAKDYEAQPTGMRSDRRTTPPGEVMPDGPDREEDEPIREVEERMERGE